MNFKKDLLLVDLETTGLDPKKHEIIQLAAVLLDKKTLKEKKTFNSYIKPRKWGQRNLESMAVNKISWDILSTAESKQHVLKEFKSFFNPQEVILSYYVGVTDIVFLKAAFESVDIPFNFDYHYFNIWGLFYGYLAGRNKLNNNRHFTGFSLEDLIKQFKLNIETSSLHDALADCRAEAEILRRVMKAL